ncbi:MAG: carbohydrate ABC transporter permease, partial [Tissierellia bacterium]|nr:carbohydrate ABC transporter permease [Tissierellia bacterium]
MKNVKTERLLTIIILLYLLIIIFPFIWVLITSFKPESEIWGTNALSIFGSEFTTEHYRSLFRGEIFNAL